jgi:CubicO group peptidase (beta-lactamase class C family)
MGPLARFLAELARLGGVVSAAEALVAEAGRVLWRGAAGFRVGGEALAAGAGARFDAASLTKPWMATLALVLDRQGSLPLAARLGDLAPAVAPALAARTLEDLLRHRAGLPAWTPLAVRLGRRFREREALVELLAGGTLPSASPVGVPAGALYSDLGYILWGLLAERSTGRNLADLLDGEVCAPLGLPPLGALSTEPPFPVECRLDNGREVELAAEQGIHLARQRSFLQGHPQDGNARALGFLTAHAGLFVTADEMLALAREWLAPGRLLTRDQVERAVAGDGGWALGWARASADGSSGPALPPAAFGHAGFTGGSLWLDPQRGRILLLLAHRLTSQIDFNPFRREFHRLAAQEPSG